jgi:hypothetical protein
MTMRCIEEYSKRMWSYRGEILSAPESTMMNRTVDICTKIQVESRWLEPFYISTSSGNTTDKKSV